MKKDDDKRNETQLTLLGHEIKIVPSIDNLRSICYDDVIECINTSILNGNDGGYVGSYGVMYEWDFISIEEDVEKYTNLFLLRELDQWMSWSSQIVLGVFNSKEKALDAIKDRYSDGVINLSPNGDNQWWLEKAHSLVCSDCGHEIDIESFDAICPECSGNNIEGSDFERIGSVMITEIALNKCEEI